MNVFVTQVSLIARRSVVRNARQPGTWIPPLTFPLILMAVNSNGLRAATHLPGFPTKSFLAFFMPFAFMQGALFASGIAGVDFARDIDTIQAVAYLAVGIAAGVHISAGVGGAVLILVFAILIAGGFGTLGIWLALRTGSGEGVQSMFPLLFFLLLISSMNLPRNLIEVTWFRDLATLNPVSYLIEALRSLVIEGWNAQALALGFTFTFGLIGISMLLAARQLKVRMTRT